MVVHTPDICRSQGKLLLSLFGGIQLAYFTKLKGILLFIFMVTKETGSFCKQSIVADSKNFE